MKTLLPILLTALILSGCVQEVAKQGGSQQETKATPEEQQRLQVKKLMLQPSMVQVLADHNGRAQESFAYISPPAPHKQAEKYASFKSNGIIRTSQQSLSTFSIDVDSASYANTRRFLQQGSLPPKNAIRPEEFINYFNYDYPNPGTSAPFSLVTEVAPSPFNKNKHLLHIGIQGYQAPVQTLPPANLVFLIDVSGSMQDPSKLGLLKAGLKLLVNKLDKDDRISIAVYAGASGLALKPTPADQKIKIIQALDKLSAGGSTNGSAGLKLAYETARQNFIKQGINRVILATDGDFNLGIQDPEQLKAYISGQKENGIFLSVLGFGTGNYNDALMQTLAQNGNGNAAYIDSLMEAKKVLVDEMGATLKTIARDVKIQLEFNPTQVAEYRLIGYESRHLNEEDFNNDNVDAGEIGAGHSVTALYEITLAGSEGATLDPLRYQDGKKQNTSNELAYLKVRYKDTEKHSKLIQRAITRPEIVEQLADTSDNFRFSAAVAGFAMRLQSSTYMGQTDIQDLLDLAQDAKGRDTFGYRSEFTKLVKLAELLETQPQ